MSNQISQIVDEHCPTKGELIYHNGKTYSSVLNQTDIISNKNKFYIMQLIKNGKIITHFIRYGRTGEVGRITTNNYNTEKEAITAFEKQFKSKTGNNWTNSEFIRKEGKYFMTEVSYENELKNIKDIPTTIPDSKLDDRTQKLISMLSDVNMMQKALISLDIDTKKMPLGKISKVQLDKANEVLDKIQEIINQLGGNKMDNDCENNLSKLSSEYYTYVPISCGRKKPPIINSDQILGKYKDTIDELQNMVITVQITNNVKMGENPIDSIYKDINTNITPLSKNCEIWEEIVKFIDNSHGSTHGCKLEILDIFEIEQFNKRKTFNDNFQNMDNHTLLFHGSGMSNWLSILKNDLLLNPQKINKNIIITGKMFSDGIYFANAVSKSFGYCRSDASNGIACLALAEVALGNISKRVQADYYITKESLKKEKCDSVQGLGQYTPESTTKIGDLIIPNGKLTNTKKKRTLLYDEFIVYDSNQQFIKYLVLVKNKFYKN